MQARSIRTNDDINKLPLGAPRQNVGRGLYLLPAQKAGASHGWRFDYTHNRRRKTLSLGTYPAITLEAAEDAAGLMRSQLQAGVDPSTLRRRKALKAAGALAQPPQSLEAAVEAFGAAAKPGSFADVASRWFAKSKSNWTAGYAEKVLGRLRRHVLPRIGRRPIGEIEPRDVFEMCQGVQMTGTVETGRRICKICSAVFCQAVVEGLAERDFCREVLAQLQMPQRRHFAAITDPRELATLLRTIDSYRGTLIVRSALQLAPLVMLRPGELRQATWSEIDLDHGLWLIPSQRMKRTLDEKRNGEDHLVPLSRQAVAILERLLEVTGPSGVVFPCAGRKGRFMSGNTVNVALRSLGYCTQQQVTGHGFRATARTMLVERLQWSWEYAEMQLAHTVPDANGAAYNRASFEDDRQRMMQAWADYLDDLRNGNVTLGEKLRDRFTPVTNRLGSQQRRAGGVQ